MPPLKAQLLLEESLSAYFPEMVFTDSGITVQLHRNTHTLPITLMPDGSDELITPLSADNRCQPAARISFHATDNANA